MLYFSVNYCNTFLCGSLWSLNKDLGLRLFMDAIGMQNVSYIRCLVVSGSATTTRARD